MISALAVNSQMLIIGRAIAGTGAAGLINGALTILSACVPTQQLPGDSLLPVSLVVS